MNLVFIFVMVVACRDKESPENGRDGINGIDGTNGNDAITTLFTSQEEPPGENCTYGGIAISYGLDNNNNGILEQNEISEVIYICNPADESTDSDYWGDQGENPLTYVGNVSFSNFGDMLSFCENYIAIDGSLTISSTLLAHLDDLECLEAISGDLSINNNSKMISMHLPNLTEIGGGIIISNNAMLENVALDEILYSNDSILIQDNSSLKSISANLLFFVGFDFLTAGDLYINGNTALTNIQMPNLISVQHSLIIKNTAAIDLDGFSSLEGIGSELNIADNPELLNMSFASLIRTGGDLLIDSNAQLINLNGLSVLDFIGGSLNIENNTEMVDVTLSTLNYIGNSSGYNLYNNPNLQGVDLPLLNTIYGTFFISNNSMLALVSSSVIHSEDIIIGNNDALTTLNLSSLIDSGFINLFFNDALSTVNLNSLTNLAKLGVHDNASLNSLNFPSLVTLSGRMNIYSHQSLEEIQFPLLESTFDISISDNDSLQTFEHPTLETIYGVHSTSNYFETANNNIGDWYIVSITNNPFLSVNFEYCPLDTTGYCSINISNNG